MMHKIEGYTHAQAEMLKYVFNHGKVSRAELAQALEVVCRQNNMTLEQLKPYYDAQFEAAIIRSVLTSKVMKLIRDAAVIE